MMADMSAVNSQWNLYGGLRNKALFIYINKIGGKGTHIILNILISPSDKRTVSASPILNTEERSWWKCSAVDSGRDYRLNNDRKFKRMWILTPDCYKGMWSKTHSLYQQLPFNLISDSQLQKFLFMRRHLLLYWDILSSWHLLAPWYSKQFQRLAVSVTQHFLSLVLNLMSFER